jgi:hypothetical protein
MSCDFFSSILRRYIGPLLSRSSKEWQSGEPVTKYVARLVTLGDMGLVQEAGIRKPHGAPNVKTLTLDSAGLVIV